MARVVLTSARRRRSLLGPPKTAPYPWGIRASTKKWLLGPITGEQVLPSELFINPGLS